jgi:hypothetical protein
VDVPCKRCNADATLNKRGWCAECELAFDGWVRRYATDIIWPLMTGMTIVTTVALVLPLLGAGSLIATAGVFTGFATFFGLYRYNQRRRRQQFLTDSLPRAYLPSKT